MQKEIKQASWPFVLAPVRDALEPLRAPEGPFSPQDEWEHHYSVCALVPERQAAGEHAQPYGQLSLKRKRAGSGRFVLDVTLLTTMRAGSALRTEASITCAEDRLATPQKWQLRCEAAERGKPVTESVVQESAEVRGGAILRRGRVERKIPVPRPFSCNWSLLEAVQRLPFEGVPALEFDLFEDLDICKPGQRLVSAGTVTVPMGGRQVRLHSFRQIGRGVLPTHYWLDEQHRLIAAAGALRGFIWSDGAGAAPKEGH